MGRPRAPKKEYTNNFFKPYTAKNATQKLYFNELATKDIVFGVGAAGTGKTACAVAYACQELHFGRIEKIIITRPAVEACGEELGFLKGDLEEKYAPYLTPIREIAVDVLGEGTYKCKVEDNVIQGVPLAFCRGRTFNNAFIIVDEAQNTTPEQMKMLLTRMGRDSKVFINGDEQQTDIKGLNGLTDAVVKLSWIPSVSVVEFSRDEILRNGLISDILASYD